MADPKPQVQQLPVTITPNDLVGAIRQMLLELMGIINQPVQAIDPVLVNAYLIRMLEFNDVLPRLPANGADHGREDRQGLRN